MSKTGHAPSLLRLAGRLAVWVRRVRKVGRRTWRFTCGAFLYVLLSAFRLVLPLRVGWFTVNRVAHFVHEASFQFAERPKGRLARWLDFRTFSAKSSISNEYWMLLVRRNFVVAQWMQPAVDIARRFKRRPRWLVDPDLPFSARDQTGLICSSAQRMRFEASENLAGRSYLNSIGVSPGEPFVCLLVRDSTYLNSAPGLRPIDSGRSWEYHSYRDGDIADYRPAAEWLADRGVWVFRMGKIMAQPLGSDRPRVIDYAFSAERSDFLDIWLLANCNLCISTGTGPDIVAYVFGRKILHVNLIPAIDMWSWADVIVAPRLLRHRDSEKLLSLEEMLNIEMWRSSEYSSAGLLVDKLGKSQILAIVQEAWLRSCGTWIDSADDEQRQVRAWLALEANKSYSSMHGWRHPAARFSSEWLSMT